MRGVGTFEEAWQSFRSAARGGQWALAESLIRQLEGEFQGDRLYEAEAFQRAYLPLRALVLMEQQQFAEAEGVLIRFTQTAAVPNRQVAWARFSLARIAQADGRSSEALARYSDFAGNHPELTEAHLARWYIAELQHKQGDSRAALQSLTELLSEPSAPIHLREQAQLRRIQIAVQAENIEACMEYLPDLDQRPVGFPEQLQANFTALELQNFLRAQGHHKAALKASFQIRDYPLLLEDFQSYLTGLQQNWTLQAAHWRRQAPIWGQHLQRRIETAAASLDALRKMEPYTLPWLMGRGLSFLEAGHPWLADRLFERLSHQIYAEDCGTPTPSYAADLLYLKILCRQEIRDWNQANAHIETFYLTFPDDKRLPDVRFAQARGESLQGNYLAAAEQLDYLISDYPSHNEQLSWQWMRAQVEAQLGRIDSALEQYRTIQHRFAEHRMTPYILLSAAELAQTYNNHPEAHYFLDALESQLSPNNPLRPYGHWVRLQLCFGDAEPARFIGLRDQFLNQWPEHPLQPELINLAGDHQFQRCNWPEALSWYRRIEAEDVQQHEYARFQQVALFRQTGQPEEAWRLLKAYTHAAMQDGPKERLQEAVFTMNRLAALVDQVEPWRNQLDQLIHALGNSLAIDDFSPFLTAWQQTFAADIQPNFETWMQETEIRAKADFDWAFWSRLQLFKHRFQSGDESTAAEAMLLRVYSLAPVEALDAQALYRIGSVLAQQDFDTGPELLESLIRRYPRSQWTPRALKSLAEHHGPQSWRARSWWTDLTQQWFGTEEALWANLELARIEASEADWDSAIQRLGDLIDNRQAPANLRAHAWKKRAQSLVGSRQIVEAIHHYQRLYTLFPQYHELCQEAYLSAAQLLFEIQKVEEAKQTLSEAQLRLPSKPDLNERIELLRNEYSQNPNEAI